MKSFTRTLLLVTILLPFIQACQTKEEKVQQIVHQFLLQAHDSSKPMDKGLRTNAFNKFFDGKKYYMIESWDLSVIPENDSLIIVEARQRGGSHNQSFELINRKGEWKITNTHNFIAEEYDIEVEGLSEQWDRQKEIMINDLKQQLQIEVLVPGLGVYYGSNRKGQIRIVNNSEHDVSRIKVLIEHFDAEGRPVRSDEEYILHPIRKGGYRELTWYSNDCGSCERQEFSIRFIEEK